MATTFLAPLQWKTVSPLASLFLLLVKDNSLNSALLQCSHSRRQPTSVPKSTLFTEIKASLVGQRLPSSSTSVSSGGNCPFFFNLLMVAVFSSCSICFTFLVKFSKIPSAFSCSDGSHLKCHCQKTSQNIFVSYLCICGSEHMHNHQSFQRFIDNPSRFVMVVTKIKNCNYHPSTSFRILISKYNMFTSVFEF